MTKDRRLGRGLAALLGAALDEATGDADAREAVSVADVGIGDAAIAPEMAATTADSLVEAATPPNDPADQLLRLSVHEIDDNPFQPRRDFSEPEIASLAESLKEHDMLQTILVRRVGERHQLISG